MRILFSLALTITMGGILLGQSFNYSVALEPVAIDNLGGLQSFAHGEYDGQWLIVGGRLDGLHRRQPFASFDLADESGTFVLRPAAAVTAASELQIRIVDVVFILYFRC